MVPNRKRLGDLLLSLKLVNERQLEEALSIQRDAAAPLASVLVSLGFVSEDQILNALAAQDGVSPWRLDEAPPSAEALGRVPHHVCRSMQVIPIAVRGDLLVLGMRNALDFDAIDMVRNLTGQRIEPVLVDEGRLARAIEDFYANGPAPASVDGLVNQALAQFNKLSTDGVATPTALNDADTRPVVGLVNQVLSEAIRMGASDIHVEPRATRVDIRYRVDGMLRKVRDIPSSLLPMFVTRLKIMAEMDIVEFRLPQDGRVAATIDGRVVDLRVSSLPNQHGQRMVLRILDKTRSLKKLDEIGFARSHLELFRAIIRRPYGIVLVTGPTGSGKTTTLYAALQELRAPTTNVMTCEDPIEYEIDGINQSQVNEKVGLTFAAQLRAILRQDPDVILVGEIRDEETAQTAIRAALTGHLVLSTLHCNDAPSAIPRLLDMNVDPFLLSTSLIGVMSQRLVRIACAVCGGKPGRGADKCLDCGGTGFKGRTGVHEMMPITGAVAAAIGRRASMEEICQAAYLAGYKPMEVAAEALVRAGTTTRAEARRHIYYSSPDSVLDAVKPAA